MASLYSAQCSPIAARKLVYSGSRSMRWAVLIVFAGFCVAGAEVTSDLLGMMGVPEGCRMESERLRAAGSMSGMVSKMGGMGGASTIRALS